jgi:hypothetical protein
MERPCCILFVSYCNFILETDKEENLKHWKTNACHLYDKHLKKGGENEKNLEIKKALPGYVVNAKCGRKTCWHGVYNCRYSHDYNSGPVL